MGAYAVLNITVPHPLYGSGQCVAQVQAICKIMNLPHGNYAAVFVRTTEGGIDVYFTTNGQGTFLPQEKFDLIILP